LRDVEILRANVRIHGRGSPAAGDIYSAADLRALCDAHAELADELRPVATIGHDGTDRPALGTLEHLRVSADGTRLLCDVKDVPRAFAELVNARAYNARSIELSKVTSERTGRTFPKVITALAWLGARMPAVRGLNDVVALYESGGVELLRAYTLDNGGRSGKSDALVTFAVQSGRITESDRPAWTRALEERGDDAIRELAQLPPDSAVSDDDYARDFAARNVGQRPFLTRTDDEVTRRELSAVDPESREIAARLGLDPMEVL
jgi:hypothetical protein